QCQTQALGGLRQFCNTQALIAPQRERGAKGLTVISNKSRVDGFGQGQQLETRHIKKMISSNRGENHEIERPVQA
ncbi:succinyl-CoA--3-ketoacid-CoA transferase, partial [Stenotrophomonas maltophilia]